MKKQISKTKYIIFAAVILVLVTGVFLLRNQGTKNDKTAEKPLYIALGDSVAAGQGLQNDSDSSACYRTNQSYPKQIATNLNYNLQNISCSGASVTAGLAGKQDVNGAMFDSQIDQIGSSKPKLVTITVGANDVGWTGFIAKCFLLTCGSSADTQEAATNMAGFSKQFDAALANLKSKIPTEAKVVVTGYYRIFPNSKSDCAVSTTVSDSGLVWLNSQADALNEAIKDTVQKYPFAKFAPVSFAGHEICSQTPWIQSLNDKAAFHPTSEGQAEIARLVTKSIGK